jgi:DNA-binding transcriptional LysR family regulator
LPSSSRWWISGALRTPPISWGFRARFTAPDGQELAVPISGNLRANNGLAEREAALRGLGVMMSPTFFVGELIREGRLQAVLTDYKAPETAVYAIYPERKYLSKVRAFIEFFAQRFGPKPYWDRFEKKITACPY